MNRRRLLAQALRTATLAAGAGSAHALPADAAGHVHPAVTPGRVLTFPRDFGAHPAWRTEWWYVTGWLRDGVRALGVQVTFFRARTRHPDANPSRFAPRELLFAHAAIADPARGHLVHEQAAARAGFDLSGARETDTDVRLPGWRMWRTSDDTYRVSIASGHLDLDLRLVPDGAPVLQGDRGFSRKGPRPLQASYYYSRPQLQAQGRISVHTAWPKGRTDVRSADRTRSEVGGVCWLDHEWSSEILDPQAAGWDWVGLNLDDGSALMAFRIRARDGAVLWSSARWVRTARAGTTRAVQAANAAAQPDPSVRFEALRIWRSPRSGARYPTAMRVLVGARVLELQPMFDDQELDARASTGTIYWEGAVRVFEESRAVGLGYLELTGYASPLAL